MEVRERFAYDISAGIGIYELAIVLLYMCTLGTVPDTHSLRYSQGLPECMLHIFLRHQTWVQGSVMSYKKAGSQYLTYFINVTEQIPSSDSPGYNVETWGEFVWMRQLYTSRCSWVQKINAVSLTGWEVYMACQYTCQKDKGQGYHLQYTSHMPAHLTRLRWKAGVDFLWEASNLVMHKLIHSS